ncbi:major histocompatibility complex class I-related protein 1-like isoform X2 [Vanacampus margaritifer]
MIMNLILLFILAKGIPSVMSVIHTLKYFKIASSDVPKFPDFRIIGYVDDVKFVYCDSKGRKAEATQDWVNKITADEPHFWETQTQDCVDRELIYKANIKIAQERFNQTGGIHFVQKMYGCEWNDETDEVDGWEYDAYDGEDFIALSDVKTMTWTAAKQQAFVTKLNWERLRSEYWKYYYTEICPSLLKKFVKYGRDAIMRTELPTVSLLQKTPSSPVTCHATGFYPQSAVLFWRKDGEEHYEDVDVGQTLPNHDGTFQMTADLKVELTEDTEGKFECVFQLSGVKEDIVTKLERRSIKSNGNNKEINLTVPIAATLGVLALVIVLAAVIVKLYRKRYDEYTSTSCSSVSERSRNESVE